MVTIEHLFKRIMGKVGDEMVQQANFHLLNFHHVHIMYLSKMMNRAKDHSKDLRQLYT